MGKRKEEHREEKDNGIIFDLLNALDGDALALLEKKEAEEKAAREKVESARIAKRRTSREAERQVRQAEIEQQTSLDPKQSLFDALNRVKNVAYVKPFEQETEAFTADFTMVFVQSVPFRTAFVLQCPPDTSIPEYERKIREELGISGQELNRRLLTERLILAPYITDQEVIRRGVQSRLKHVERYYRYYGS